MVYFYFGLNLFCKISSTIREICLASLDHVVYIGINLQSKWIKNLRALPRSAQPCGLFRLKSPVKIRSKIWYICLASLDDVVYFNFNLRLNSQQNFETSVSLHSTMWFISAQIYGQNSIKNLIVLPRFAWQCGLLWLKSPVKIWSKIESFASLRSTMWFISA